ncbi:MAG: alpha/beta hydrolase [Deltaproteobacteria bacterium]|nr:alpha/beta hydrolase [Deltaproteobacteria bacterium]
MASGGTFAKLFEVGSASKSAALSFQEVSERESTGQTRPMRAPDLVGDVKSFDGTRIRYQVFGEGPPLVFGNGIGVGFRGLRLQRQALERSFRLVFWDHRGVFDSERPLSGELSVSAQARDCLRVMDELGIECAGYIGWSMGVQVGLEAVRHGPGRLSRLALISGVAGRPGRAAIPLPIDSLVGLTLRAPLPGLARRAWRRISSERFLRAAIAAGYVRPGVHRESFLVMTQGVAGHDPDVYLGTLAEVLKHDANDVLDSLEIPVLFIGGQKDKMTPPRALERLAKRARGSVRTIEGGSHFALLERPDEVNAALLSFFS